MTTVQNVMKNSVINDKNSICHFDDNIRAIHKSSKSSQIPMFRFYFSYFSYLWEPLSMMQETRLIVPSVRYILVLWGTIVRLPNSIMGKNQSSILVHILSLRWDAAHNIIDTHSLSIIDRESLFFLYDTVLTSKEYSYWLSMKTCCCCFYNVM